MAQISYSRLKEVIVRTIREVDTNGQIMKTGKAYLEWARGILVKKGGQGKGFELKLNLPTAINPLYVYGDIRGSTAWATRLVLCQTFQWDKSKSRIFFELSHSNIKNIIPSNAFRHKIK